MIATDLSKQQVLVADSRAIRQINFTVNLDIAGNTTMLFIIEEARETVLDLPQGTFCKFNFYQYKMTQYNSLNINLSNSQLNKLKSAIKNESEVVLRLSPSMIGDNETNFPHQLLLTTRQVANIRKAFANHSSTNIKLSKSQLSMMIQSGGFLRRLLRQLIKIELLLI